MPPARPARPLPSWRCATCSTAAPRAISGACTSTSRPPKPCARMWGAPCVSFWADWPPALACSATGSCTRGGPTSWPPSGEGALTEALTCWCQADPTPVVLLIDKIDSLIGDTLISVLRQLRDGYVQRPESFPHSIVLCGVRDVRDYRIRSSSENATVAGGSAFNVRAESMRLGDFTEAEVRALLAQHTAETGQAFTPEALATVWRQARGQPWLVNALCRKALLRLRDRARPVAPGCRRGPPERPGGTHSEPGDASRSARRQAQGRARAARDRATAERRWRARVPGPPISSTSATWG